MPEMKPKTQEEEIEKNINIQFKKKALLHQALIHRSYLNENKQEKSSNERLEFLGDAVLEFVVSERLYHSFPHFSEGKLTALRAKLVNTRALAAIARKLKLGEAIYLSKGEESNQGRSNTSLLANTLEALIGAIFLDQGIQASESFINRFILSRIPDIAREPLKDAKSLLQELVQSRGLPAPIYKTIREEGPDHAKEFTVQVLINKKPVAWGRGSSKQTAAQNAAKKALARLRNNFS